MSAATSATHEFGYKLTTGSGVSEIVALNDHQTLVDERDGKGLGDGTSAAVKQLFFDIVNALNVAGGINDPKRVRAKLEGLAFGADVVIDGEVNHTLYLANDNDFVRTSRRH